MGLAKWAKRSCAREFLKVKISRAGGLWFGDDRPSSCKDILTKLRHKSPELYERGLPRARVTGVQLERFRLKSSSKYSGPYSSGTPVHCKNRTMRTTGEFPGKPRPQLRRALPRIHYNQACIQARRNLSDALDPITFFDDKLRFR